MEIEDYENLKDIVNLYNISIFLKELFNYIFLYAPYYYYYYYFSNVHTILFEHLYLKNSANT